ncbi:DegV family protein [Candidatus Mycoplasma pogonae]
MKKKVLGIIIDSFSSVSQTAINSYENFYLLPLRFEIDGKQYIDNGIELQGDELIEKLNNAKKIFTSQPSPYDIEHVIDKASEECEEVIYLAISSELSSTYANATTYASKKTNVTVLDSHIVGESFIWLGKKLQKMYQDGVTSNDIIAYFEKYNKHSLNYLLPENLDSLVRGGRLKGIKKVLLTSISLSLILKVNAKGINFGGIKRSFMGAVKKTVTSLIDFIGGETQIKNYEFQILHGGNEKAVTVAESIMRKFNITPAAKPFATPIILIHTGTGCISIAVSPKIN